MSLASDTDAQLNAFAIRTAEEFNARVGPFPVILINGLQVSHVKGNGKLLSTLEITDKIIYGEAGQILVATYLGGTQDDLADPAIWDKNAIG